MNATSTFDKNNAGHTLGAILGGSISACSFRVWYQMGFVVTGRMEVLPTDPPNRATTYGSLDPLLSAAGRLRAWRRRKEDVGDRRMGHKQG